MKTATIRQVRNDFGKVLEWVAAGEEVTILRRNRPVARIVPPRPEASPEVALPDFTERARAIFGGRRTRLVESLLREREKRNC
jgi:prevent-host-death family protein